MDNIKNKRDMFAYTFATYQGFCKNHSCTCCPMMENRGVCAIETDAEAAADILENWDNNNPAHTYLDEYCKRMGIKKSTLLQTSSDLKNIIGCKRVAFNYEVIPNCAFEYYTDKCKRCWNEEYRA